VVDGVPRIGFGQNPEQHLQPFFDIRPGGTMSYCRSIRTLATAVGYVDGKVVTRTDNLPPGLVVHDARRLRARPVPHVLGRG
jgi:hypothetical protein